jgi:hypothetical protein
MPNRRAVGHPDPVAGAKDRHFAGGRYDGRFGHAADLGLADYFQSILHRSRSSRKRRPARAKAQSAHHDIAVGQGDDSEFHGTSGNEAASAASVRTM